MVLEGALTEPTTQITGGVIVFDMDGLTLQHAWQFNPAIAKRIVELLQVKKILLRPVKISKLHNFNLKKIFKQLNLVHHVIEQNTNVQSLVHSN